jgi:ComF family protein
MHSLIKNCLKQCQAILLPYYCIICQSKSKQALDICKACESELPFIKENAKRDNLQALMQYKAPISTFITQLKFQQQLKFSRLLGALFVKHIELENKPDFIIPIPLHPKRLKQRGFNQSLEIAKVISKKLKIPIDYKSLIRIKHTQTQSELPAKERKRNVKSAFHCHTDFTGQTILLLDDVITTGHTISETYKTLEKANPSKIDIWAIARTERT